MKPAMENGQDGEVLDVKRNADGQVVEKNSRIGGATLETVLNPTHESVQIQRKVK